MSEDEARLDRSYIGREYQSSPKIAKAEAMIAYAKATNETNPVYFDTESPDGPSHSPLYPVVFIPELLSQLVDDAEDMNLDLLRVVHAEQEMWWREKIRPGDKITSNTKIVNIEQIGVNDLLDMHIQCKREDITLVDMRYRLIMRGKKKGTEKKSTPKEEGSHGVKIAERVIVVTDDQGQRYAEASGDHNPIHLSDDVARLAGLPSAILQGLCTMAFASQTIVDELLDGDPTRLRYMKVRFSKPVLMGEALTTEVHETGIQEDSLHVVHFETMNPAGAAVLKNGVAKFSEG